jgi:hypothetical protein
MTYDLKHQLRAYGHVYVSKIVGRNMNSGTEELNSVSYVV